MNVTLVSTLNAWRECPGGDPVAWRDFCLPLGLLTVAGVLEAAGCQVSVVDPNVTAWLARSDDRRDVYEEVIAQVLGTVPDVIAFGTASDSYHHTLFLARALGARSTATIVFGGPHASAVAEDTLKASPAVDWIVRGEAENVVVPLVHAIETGRSLAGVNGIVRREDASGRIVANAPAALPRDLDAVPIPAFHHYANVAEHVRFIPIEAGRGCPFKCAFCATSRFFGRQYRLKSGERILEEMRCCEASFGTEKPYRLIHDMLTLDRERLMNLCRVLGAAPERRRWWCSARTDCVDIEMLHAMAGAGCEDVCFGVETASRRLQLQIGKGIDVGSVEDSLVRVADAGITATVCFIAGFPDESVEELAATLGMITNIVRTRGNALHPQLQLLAVPVGTRLYEEHRQELEYDGYPSEQTLQTIDPELDQEMLAHPQLFSTFFFVPTHGYDRRLLHGLDTFVNAVLGHYPLTTLAMVDLAGEPLRAYREWQRIMLARLTYRQLAPRTVGAQEIDAGVAKWVCESADRSERHGDLLALAAYERSVAAAVYDRSAPFPGRRRPAGAAGGVRVINTRVDVAGVRRSLRDRQPLPPCLPMPTPTVIVDGRGACDAFVVTL